MMTWGVLTGIEEKFSKNINKNKIHTLSTVLGILFWRGICTDPGFGNFNALLKEALIALLDGFVKIPPFPWILKCKVSTLT